MDNDDARVLADRLGQAGSAVRFADLRERMGWRQVEQLKKRAALVPLSRTVLGSSASSPDLPTRLRRAETLVGRPLIAYGRSAASLHGFGLVDDGLLHVTTIDGWSKPGPAGVVVHQCVPRSSPVEVSGIKATEPSDTAVDVARSQPELDTLAILDAAARSGIDHGELTDAVARAGGLRGVIRVRRWLPFADWRSDSPMESRTRYRLLVAGLRPPDLQIAVCVGTNRYRYIDLGWRAARVGFDYDGEEFHGSASLTEDRRRHNQLADAGWHMFYPTALDVYRDSQALVASASRALGSPARLEPQVQAALIPRPAGSAKALLAQSRRTWAASGS